MSQPITASPSNVYKSAVVLAALPLICLLVSVVTERFESPSLTAALRIGAGVSGALALGAWLAGRAIAQRAQHAEAAAPDLFLVGFNAMLVLTFVVMLINGALTLLLYGTFVFPLLSIAPTIVVSGIGLSGFFLVIVVVAGIVNLGKALLLMHRTPRPDVPAQVISRDDAPELWRFAEEAAAQLNAKAPDNILAGFDGSAWVVEGRLRCVTKQMKPTLLKGRTLFIDLLQASVVNIDDLRVVLSHEMQHFSPSHEKSSRRFWPIYRGAWLALQGMYRWFDETSFARQLFLRPPIMIIETFMDGFVPIERRMSRVRELDADAASIRLCGARQSAVKLVKVHLLATSWETTVQAVRYEAGQEQLIASLIDWYKNSVRWNATREQLERLVSKSLPHPLDTHPSLEERLQKTGFSLNDVADDALAPAGSTTALSLIRDAAGIDQRLSMMIGYQAVGREFVEAAKSTGTRLEIQS